MAVLGGVARSHGSGTVAGGQARHVDVVLDQAGHAGEFPAVPQALVRASAGRFKGVQRQTVERRVHRLDALDGGVGELRRTALATAQQVGQGGGVVVTEGVITEGMKARFGGGSGVLIHRCVLL